MFCSQCGKPMNPNDRFCKFCGSPNRMTSAESGYASPQNPAGSNPQNASSAQYAYTTNDAVKPAYNVNQVLNGVAHKINSAAGIETPDEVKFSEIFSKVFQKHSAEEAELLFTVGTSHTTPDLNQVDHTWPKPWLFARVLMLVGISYLLLYLGVTYFNNVYCIPGLIIMGAFMIPVSLLVFFWEMNVTQNISIYKVIKLFMIGGISSLIIALIGFQLAGNSGGAQIIIGIVEEAAKVAAILIFIKDKRCTTILNGLLIGAAIGTGFSAFESAGYAFYNGIQYGMDTMFNTLFWRALLAPGGHIVWAGLSGAALYMVKGAGEFKGAMLTDFRFLRVFGIVVLLHAAWDLPIPDIAGIPMFLILLTVVSWVIVFAMINTGLKQVSRQKSETPAVSPQQIPESSGMPGQL